eukprot:TRINITY_DN2910_c0_g4_i1.p1 TRINITY_DN2910_c0_g4~~TRINITY_DN2910_c0_g4_i1.p1  ORF type:complete len:232 (+),score=55.75 TRINITY_DN2910_c0_g4_i1:135-830(+)
MEDIKLNSLKLQEEEKTTKRFFNLTIADIEEDLSEALALEQIDEVLELSSKTAARKSEVAEFLRRYDKENAFAHDSPEMVKHIEFIRWAKRNGCDVRKTKIVVYAKNYRGVHATKDISVNETVISVPISLAVSGLNTEITELGTKLTVAGAFDKKWRSYIFPLLHVLSELRNPSSEIKEWLAVTPSCVDDHPMFFTKEESLWLQSSPTLGSLPLNINRAVEDRQSSTTAIL